MNIDPKESNYFFQNHVNRELDMYPENISDVVIEWVEKVIDGEYNIMTHRDTRRYEYRVRAIRVFKNTKDEIWKTNILMDTGKYMSSLLAHKHVDKFIKEQETLEEYRSKS